MIATAAEPQNILALVLLEAIISSLVMVGGCAPLIQGKIEMNQFYGFRISKAFKSKENWYAINRYGGRVLATWSVIIGLVVILLALIFKDAPVILEVLTLMPLLYLLPVIQTSRYAAKLP